MYCCLRKILSFFVLLFIAETGVCQNTSLSGSAIHIIPKPVSVQAMEGDFQLNNDTRIVIGDKRADDVAGRLKELLERPTGFRLSLIEKKTENIRNAIILKLNKKIDTQLDSAGYMLNVTPQRVIIKANKPRGLFYGIQTLMQLFPPAIESVTVVKNIDWKVPCVKIVDYPRFSWRGLMLDVSRHFFTVKEVKAYIDEMAKYKFNVFHWHLTDDHGWRIEIKGLPLLTEVGAWRVPRTGRHQSFKGPQPGEKATYGGFYTQEEIRAVIAYAQKHFVTILPEIDVPAHSLALIAAYPNLSSTKKQYQVWPQYPPANVDNVLDVASDSTWLILDKVFTQVAQLFPGSYIHVGGDEANRSFWMKNPQILALMKKEGIKTAAGIQSYFEKKLEKIIVSKGKRMIGWDEILEGGIAPEAAVMSWRGMKGGIEAAKLGHKVVMTPTTNAYLDYLQGDPLVEPYGGGRLLLRTCYDFEPVPDGVEPQYILGGQGNLWTENVANFRHVEYMTWPRALALSEVFWSPKENKDWPDFVRRMNARFRYMDVARVKYARSQNDAIISSVKTAGGSIRVKLETQIPGMDIYYRFDGSNPDNFSPKYEGHPIAIPKGASEIRVITYSNGKPIGHQINCPISKLKKR